MSDPADLLAEIAAAEDAFAHATGEPRFEPGLNSRADADDGEVRIQKACRLLELTDQVDDLGEYYGAILEHSFIVIEHTLSGYLLAVTGTDSAELRDHHNPYEYARGQVPLEDDTIASLKRLYEHRRTSHYYDTTVTTANQAARMRTVAKLVHDYIVGFDVELERFCLCGSPGSE